MWAAVALAFGLAMDATAVSAARGLGGRAAREAVILPVLFGGFQAGMAALGWFAGWWCCCVRGDPAPGDLPIMGISTATNVSSLTVHAM